MIRIVEHLASWVSGFKEPCDEKAFWWLSKNDLIVHCKLQTLLILSIRGSHQKTWKKCKKSDVFYTSINLKFIFYRYVEDTKQNKKNKKRLSRLYIDKIITCFLSICRRHKEVRRKILVSSLYNQIVFISFDWPSDSLGFLVEVTVPRPSIVQLIIDLNYCQIISWNSLIR